VSVNPNRLKTCFNGWQDIRTKAVAHHASFFGPDAQPSNDFSDYLRILLRNNNDDLEQIAQTAGINPLVLQIGISLGEQREFMSR
jgi:hypothetical protein